MSVWHDWQAFSAREPFGPASWDQRIGWVLAVLVEAITGKRIPVTQMMPQWSAPQAEDWRGMRAKMQAWGKAVNAYNRQN